jgi:ribose transport system substrate-binding protein
MDNKDVESKAKGIEGLASGTVSRRDFLKYAGVAGGTIAAAGGLGGLLAACGSGSTTTTAATTATTAAGTATTAATTATTAAGTATTAAGTATTNAALATRTKHMDSFYTLNNDFWTGFDNGCAAACGALNMDHYQAVDEFDVAKQKAFFEAAPAQGTKSASMILNDEGSSTALIGALAKAGVSCVNTYSTAPWVTPDQVDPFYSAYITCNNVQGAYSVCKEMFTMLGGNGNFVHVEGVKGNSSSEERTQGVDLALKEFPGIKMVARQVGQYSRGGTQPVMESIITANPKIDAVFCQNDDSGIGAITALKSAKLKPLVGGVDAIPEFLDMIASGDATATFGNNGPLLNGLGTVMAWDVLHGYKPDITERMMYMACYVIDTAESAQLYKKLMYGGGGKFPYDWQKMSRVLHPDDWEAQSTWAPIEPDKYWAWRESEKPAGYQASAAYASADFAKATALWASHAGTDPLAAVVKLTKNPTQKPIL